VAPTWPNTVSNCTPLPYWTTTVPFMKGWNVQM
jgi:hypothetical protein